MFVLALFFARVGGQIWHLRTVNRKHCNAPNILWLILEWLMDSSTHYHEWRENSKSLAQVGNAQEYMQCWKRNATLVDWQHSKVFIGYPMRIHERNPCLLTMSNLVDQVLTWCGPGESLCLGLGVLWAWPVWPVWALMAVFSNRLVWSVWGPVWLICTEQSNY